MRARAPSASLALVLFALTASLVSAPAQDYPSRAVTIVAPAAPGGLYSLFARLIGSKLEQRLGKPFVVENRPGASSIVGAMSVIRGPHDGYTLMVGNTSGLATNISLHKSLPYDPVKDFAPIALIARIPEVLMVNAALPVQPRRPSRQPTNSNARCADPAGFARSSKCTGLQPQAFVAAFCPHSSMA